jgi:hypothetical protein
LKSATLPLSVATGTNKRTNSFGRKNLVLALPKPSRFWHPAEYQVL